MFFSHEHQPSRYFVPPPALTTVPEQQHNHHNYNYANSIETLYSRCQHYYAQAQRQHPHNYYRGTLYHGGLGAAAFLPWKVALWLEQSDGNRRQELLQSALNATDQWLAHNDNHNKHLRPQQCCTLLESPMIGALATKTAILHALGRDGEVQNTASRLERVLTDATSSLGPGDCEVLYGRAGSLHAILFVRTHGGLPDFAPELAERLIREILHEGTETGSPPSMLMWSWHGKEYLGAAHGVAGILHALLHFAPELQRLGAVEQHGDENYFLNRIQQTLHELNDSFCFASGNLASSVSSSSDDRLVQWCHGAPGYVLLLVQASRVFPVPYRRQYLQQAQTVCDAVIARRGLLRKGLGLCHGIAGNAYSFLAVHRALLACDGDDDKDNKDDSTAATTKQQKRLLQQANAFAQFGLDHLNELEARPDHPYSLYEGLAGFVSLLIDLQQGDDDGNNNPDRSFFPCYEYVSP